MVLDGAGAELAAAAAQGSRNLGGSFWNPPGHARTAAPAAAARLLEELLADDTVAGALR